MAASKPLFYIISKERLPDSYLSRFEASINNEMVTINLTKKLFQII